MKYYSTNRNTPEVTLKEAVVKGLAADNGLFMPERINKFEPSFFENIHNLSFQEIAFEVALKFFGDDIEGSTLKTIVYDTLQFDCPLVKVTDNIYSLELFHGPTLAFKDIGARFMARLLSHFMTDREKQINVLVATSGDTGSAVANGFLDVEGVHVYVLYPKGKVSKIQESQFTTLERNITALEIEGTFDDCQHLVKSAFLDKELNDRLVLTSANSINVARFLPQSFYYFYAFAQLQKEGALKDKSLVFSVPSGNLGNITSGLFAKKMGLPVHHFIAANNANRVVYDYINLGDYTPRPSIETIANAMDVGNPSNFARILDLYHHIYPEIIQIMKSVTYTDEQIRETIQKVYEEYDYLCDPHGACGFRSLEETLKDEEVGVFLETAHPAKFIETVEGVIGKGNVEMPEKLSEFMRGKKKSVQMNNEFTTFKSYLLNNSK